LALGAEIVRLAVEAVLEVVVAAEDEVEVLIEIDDRRRVRNSDIAGRLRARAVEMLMPGVERNREQGACVPLKGDALAFVVPDRRRTAAFEDQDHLLIELPVRPQFSAWRYRHHLAGLGHP